MQREEGDKTLFKCQSKNKFQQISATAKRKAGELDPNPDWQIDCS
jgi:hypothetical protein